MGWVLAALAAVIGFALVIIAITGSQSTVWANITGSALGSKLGLTNANSSIGAGTGAGALGFAGAAAGLAAGGSKTAPPAPKVSAGQPPQSINAAAGAAA